MDGLCRCESDGKEFGAFFDRAITFAEVIPILEAIKALEEHNASSSVQRVINFAIQVVIVQCFVHQTPENFLLCMTGNFNINPNFMLTAIIVECICIMRDQQMHSDVGSTGDYFRLFLIQFAEILFIPGSIWNIHYFFIFDFSRLHPTKLNNRLDGLEIYC